MMLQENKIKTVLEKQFIYKGYRAYILALPMGHRCGYVEIPINSIFFNKRYDEKLPIPKSVLNNKVVGKRGVMSLLGFDGETITMEVLFDVHGSITFSESSLMDKTNSWFIGFDCAHAGDRPDPSITKAIFADIDHGFGEIRTLEYVELELKSLIDQIIIFEAEYNPS